MKLRFWLLTTAVITIVACAGKTEKKVDSANEDYRRLQVIEQELNRNGVSLVSTQMSAGAIATMDQGTLRRTHDLLVEFVNRGNNVITTSQRKDVRIINDNMGKVEMAVGTAKRLVLKTEETLNGAGNACAERNSGPSPSIPKRVAESYVMALDRRIVRQLDLASPQVDRVPGSCRQFTVSYPTKSGRCGLTVLVDWNQILPEGTDREIGCDDVR